MAVAGFALFVLGLIFVIVAPINKKKNTRCSQETQGVLTDIRKRYSSGRANGHTYFYSYRVDGIEYRIKSTVLSSDADGAGSGCTIWYNPRKPKQAQPFHYDSLKIYDILLIIGIVTVLAGFALMVIGLAQQT
jgi:hypothetical protein